MMKKHLMLASIFLSAFAPVHAMDHGSVFKGGFLGANFGGAVGVSDSPASFNNGGTVFQPGDSGDAGVKGVRGGLMGGYDFAIASFARLGLEIAADIGNAEGNLTRNPDNNVAYRVNLKRKDAFSAALRFGGVINHLAMLYLKVGVEKAKWNTRFESNDPQLAAKNSDSKSERLTALILGLGVELHAMKNVSIGLEGSYTLYKSSGNLTLNGAAGNPVVTANFKPRVLDARLRVLYRW